MTLYPVKRRLARIIAVRLVVSTLLLGWAIAIELTRPDGFPVDPFLFLIALTYALSIVYLGALRVVDRWPAAVDLQFAADAVVVSAFIHLTGGITSNFSSLYVLPIIAASTVRSRRVALQIASLSATLYTGLVFAQYLDVGVVPAGWWMPLSAPLPGIGFAQYTVAINLAGMLAVALLSGSLAERLRSARAGLEDATFEIADLRAFNDHLVASLTSGLVTADAQGRILTFNPAAARITGVAPVDARGRSVRELLQLPAEGSTTDGSLAECRLEIPFERPGGDRIEIGLTISPLTFPEGTSGHLVTFQDITSLRQLERERRLQQRLAAVGEMAAGIAHEIRNPLASMAGSIELLRSEVSLSPDHAELLDIALRESNRLNERIRMFLAYARPQGSGRVVFDARQVVRDAALLLRNSVDARPDHEIEVDVPAAAATFEGDETEIRQVLWSLGTNGLRAMPQGGRLVLSCRPQPAEAEVEPTVGRGRGGRHLTFVVADQGCGIPPEELDQIFQPYRRSFAKGAGLGLAIVHRIVTDHGGHIQVSSAPGAGTTVSVRLPVDGTDDSSARAGRVAVPSTGEAAPPLEAGARTGVPVPERRTA